MSWAFYGVFALLCLLGIGWIGYNLVKAAFTKPKRNRYVGRPVPDERNWQGAFHRSLKP